MATEEEKDNALKDVSELLKRVQETQLVTSAALEASKNNERELAETIMHLNKIIEADAPKARSYEKYMATGHSMPLKQLGGIFEYEIKVKGKFKRVSNQDIYKVLVQAGDVNEWHSLLQKGKQHGFVEVPKECPDGKIRYSIQALPKAIEYTDRLLRSAYEVKEFFSETAKTAEENIPEFDFVN